MRLGRLDEGRKIDEELSALPNQYLFGEQTFERASIAALLGEKDRAVALLRQALGEGLHYFWVHGEFHLESLHGYPPYEELMKPRD